LRESSGIGGKSCKLHFFGGGLSPFAMVIRDSGRRGKEMQKTDEIVIVGGGLAGLTAAVTLARTGRRVTLLEKSEHLGGRAITEQKQGFAFNLGPHALYALSADGQCG
jgi:NADPH-dependent 2,4-dienoyl-CoA reductase/sulfur reductase-like enzyme